MKGAARMLRTREELEEAERAQLLPWTATVKQHYIRIVLPSLLPAAVSGSVLNPDRDSSFA